MGYKLVVLRRLGVCVREGPPIAALPMPQVTRVWFKSSHLAPSTPAFLRLSEKTSKKNKSIKNNHLQTSYENAPKHFSRFSFVPRRLQTTQKTMERGSLFRSSHPPFGNRCLRVCRAGLVYPEPRRAPPGAAHAFASPARPVASHHTPHLGDGENAVEEARPDTSRRDSKRSRRWERRLEKYAG